MSRRDFSKDPVLIRLEELAAQQRVGGMWEHLAGSYPALLPAAGFIGGVLTAYFFSTGLYLPVLLCFVCLCLWPFTRTLKDQRHRLIAAMILSTAAMFSLGLVRMEYWKRPAANDLSRAIGQSPRPVQLRGCAASDIRKEDRESWVFGTLMPGASDGGSFYLDVHQAQAVEGWAQVRGCVRVQVGGRPPAIKAGDRVEICCVLSRFEAPANPWQFDVKQYMRLRGVCGAAIVENAAGVEAQSDAGGRWCAKALWSVRRKAFEALMADGPETPDERTGLAEALLLGRRSNLRADTLEAFFRTGLAHFISLSGMHVGILAGAVWGLGRLMGLGKRGRAALTVIVVVIFGLVVPPRAPTLRGVVLCVFFCLGVLLSRRVRPLNTLAVTAIAILLFRPADLLTAGWQLSYMTVLGIILFYEPIQKAAVVNGLGRLEWFGRIYRGGGFAGGWAWFLLWFVELFCVGLAAWIGGAGILLWHFGTITAGTTLWTVLLLPVVTGILFVGFAKIVIGALLPSAGAALGILLIWLSGVFLWAVKQLAQWDFLSVSIGAIPVWIALSYYGCLFLLRTGSWIRGGIARHAGILLLGLVAVLGIGAVKMDNARPGRLELWPLSVGHGQAAVARMPGGQTVLFDAGSISVKDVGRRVVGQFLKSYGIRRIEAVAISHGDIDHFNGLPEILQMFDIGGVYVNEELAERMERTAAGYVLKENFRQAGITARTMRDWPGGFGDVQIKSLWPVEDAGAGLESNDRSEVMLIEWAGRKILLCGDIEEYGQGKVLELYPELRADVMLLPHHGSAKNLLPEFVSRIGAKTVLASCGRLRVSGAYQPVEGVKSYYTGLDGALRVVIERNGTINIDGTKAGQ